MVIYKYYRKERFKYFVFRSGVEVDWIVWGGGRHQKVKSRVEKKGGKTHANFSSRYICSLYMI